MIVKYEKLFNLGNYENEKFGIELEVGAGETPAEAWQRAKYLVETQHVEAQAVRDLLRARIDADGALQRRIASIRAAHTEHKKLAYQYDQLREKLLSLTVDGTHVPVLTSYQGAPMSDERLEALIADLSRTESPAPVPEWEEAEDDDQDEDE